MELYRARGGNLAEEDGRWYVLGDDWNALMRRDDLAEYLQSQISVLTASATLQGTVFLPPITEQEVWAAGVTYYRSRTARMQESQAAGGGDFYDRVYDAERPELFFKAMPRNVVGPGGCVHMRADSKWNVPEPELTLLLSRSGKLIGYTIGNDMSSRDIEGENPLYLPQAKVYERSCALGPCILVHQEPLPPETTIQITVKRQRHTVFSDETTLAQMKRSTESLAAYLFRENTFPNGCFLLTGTGIVPPENFSLRTKDEICITIEPIGTLINSVD